MVIWWVLLQFKGPFCFEWDNNILLKAFWRLGKFMMPCDANSNGYYNCYTCQPVCMKFFQMLLGVHFVFNLTCVLGLFPIVNSLRAVSYENRKCFFFFFIFWNVSLNALTVSCWFKKKQKTWILNRLWNLSKIALTTTQNQLLKAVF